MTSGKSLEPSHGTPKASRSARLRNCRDALRLGAEAVEELGDRHAALELDSVVGHGAHSVGMIAQINKALAHRMSQAANQLPNPAVAGQAFAKKQVLQYNVSGSAEMTDLPLVRACASPLISMVRESSATVASVAMRIPFERSSRISTFPMALPFINDVGASHASSQARRRGISQCRRH